MTDGFSQKLFLHMSKLTIENIAFQSFFFFFQKSITSYQKNIFRAHLIWNFNIYDTSRMSGSVYLKFCMHISVILTFSCYWFWLPWQYHCQALCHTLPYLGHDSISDAAIGKFLSKLPLSWYGIGGICFNQLHLRITGEYSCQQASISSQITKCVARHPVYTQRVHLYSHTCSQKLEILSV